MLQTKFQAPETSSSGKRDFYERFIFEPKTPPPSPAAEQFLISGPPLKLIWYRYTRQCYILNFKNLSQVALKDKIFFSIDFYVSNPGHSGAGSFRLRALPFEQAWST